MNRFILITLATFFLAACQSDAPAPAAEWRDPAIFEKAIQKFEQADGKAMPPKNAVLCVGSSSIRMWHGRLAEDLAPLTVIGRGFGGSNTNDLLHFADRIVVKYQPRAVMIYEGDNDIGQGIEPDQVIAKYSQLIKKIQRDLPGCRVYILPAKPSIKRWALWPKMDRLNNELAEMADDLDGVTFIDVATPMLDEDGKPRADLFVKDNLHLNRKGYELWRDTIRPVLVEAEKAFE